MVADERPLEPDSIKPPSPKKKKASPLGKKKPRATVSPEKLREFSMTRLKRVNKITLSKIAESIGRMLDEDEVAYLKANPEFAQDVAAGKLTMDNKPNKDPVTGLYVDSSGDPFINQDQTKRRIESGEFKGNINTKSQRHRTPEEKRVYHQRIEECRSLLSLAMSTADVTKAVATKWGISRRTACQYVAIARKKQLAILKTTPEELKSDALHYWSQELLRAVTRRTRGEQQLKEAAELHKTIEEKMKANNLSDKALATLDSMMGKANKMREYGMKLLHGASLHADALRDRLDKLVGNLAPERVQLTLTDTKGNDVLSAREPLTRQMALEQATRLVQAAIDSGELPSDSLTSLRMLECEFKTVSRDGVPPDIPIEIVEEDE